MIQMCCGTVLFMSERTLIVLYYVAFIALLITALSVPIMLK
jgi:hypothetical protein